MSNETKDSSPATPTAEPSTPASGSSSRLSPAELPFSERPLWALLQQPTATMSLDELHEFVSALQRCRIPAVMRAAINNENRERTEAAGKHEQLINDFDKLL